MEIGLRLMNPIVKFRVGGFDDRNAFAIMPISGVDFGKRAIKTFLGEQRVIDQEAHPGIDAFASLWLEIELKQSALRRKLPRRQAEVDAGVSQRRIETFIGENNLVLIHCR